MSTTQTKADTEEADVEQLGGDEQQSEGRSLLKPALTLAGLLATVVGAFYFRDELKNSAKKGAHALDTVLAVGGLAAATVGAVVGLMAFNAVVGFAAFAVGAGLTKLALRVLVGGD